MPDEIIINRLSGRRVCAACGGTFHVSMLKGDKCPDCGGELFQRDDDKPETIQNRLDTYATKTAPLIEYFKGQDKLVEVDGLGDVDEVYANVKEALGL